MESIPKKIEKPPWTVVDEFLNQHGFPNACTTERTNLSTTGVGSEQVNNLYTSLQDSGGGGLLNERGSVSMGRRKFDTLDLAPFIGWFTDDVHNTTQGTFSYWNPAGSTAVYGILPANETLGTVHSDGSDRVLSKVSSDLENETTTVEVLNL